MGNCGHQPMYIVQFKTKMRSLFFRVGLLLSLLLLPLVCRLRNAFLMQILDANEFHCSGRKLFALAIGVIRIHYEWHDNDNNVQIVCTQCECSRIKMPLHVECH